VFLSVSTIFGKDGKPKAFLANHSDMSKQKREERELASAKEFQKAAIDSLTDSFFICDTTGKFLSWNKEFARAVGYEDKEIAGMKATDFFKGTDALRVADAIRKGLKTGSGKVLANVVAKDGRRLPTEFSGAVIRNSKGKIIGFAGTGRRLTEGERTKE
jgi:PAS domain S-box-containing protein